MSHTLRSTAKVDPSSKIPYLHPTERTLRSAQIGLSGHVNAYNTGVLDGNYVEDRALYEQQAQSNNYEHTYLTSNQYFHDKKNAVTNLVSNKNTEAKHTHPRGSEANHFVSMNTMTYGAGIKPESTYNLHNTQLQHQKVTETMFYPPAHDQSSTLKLSKQKIAPNESQDIYNSVEKPHLTTTYRTMMTGDGERVQSRPADQWGDATRSLNADYRKTDLRGDYPLKLTPMIKK
jgi:hypothetical protein